MTISGYYDGEKILLDERPANLRPHSRVQITVESVESQTNPDDLTGTTRRGGILDEVANSAVPGGLPADFSQQHSHYTKGAPRR
jgi:hypothetical protein